MAVATRFTLTAKSGQTPTNADFEAALETVKFNNTSDNPDTTARTIEFKVSDGTATSTAATESMAVTATVDTFTGDGGDNNIIGTAGPDLITGAAGADNMTGGLGADEFVIGNLDSGVTTETADVIQDFSSAQGDTINLSVAGTNDPAGPGSYAEISGSGVDSVEQAVTFANEYGFLGVGLASYTFIAGTADGYLVGDMNGDGTADLAVKLVGVNNESFDYTDII